MSTSVIEILKIIYRKEKKIVKVAAANKVTWSEW
jgi:hypothetical protein